MDKVSLMKYLGIPLLGRSIGRVAARHRVESAYIGQKLGCPKIKWERETMLAGNGLAPTPDILGIETIIQTFPKSINPFIIAKRVCKLPPKKL